MVAIDPDEKVSTYTQTWIGNNMICRNLASHRIAADKLINREPVLQVREGLTRRRGRDADVRPLKHEVIPVKTPRDHLALAHGDRAIGAGGEDVRGCDIADWEHAGEQKDDDHEEPPAVRAAQSVGAGRLAVSEWSNVEFHTARASGEAST